VLGEVGAGACWGFCSVVELPADGELLIEPELELEPDAPAEPDEPPAAAPWLSLFFSLEEDDPAAAAPSFFSLDDPALPPEAAEPSLLPAEDEDLPDAPPAAEPLTPRAESVFSSSSPLAFKPFCCWKSLSAFCVCGPMMPSALTFSFSWTCLIVSASCCLPPLPAAAEAPFDSLFALPADDAPAAADPPCEDLSLEALEEGVLELPEAPALPEAPVLPEVDPDALLSLLAEPLLDEPLLDGELELAPPAAEGDCVVLPDAPALPDVLLEPCDWLIDGEDWPAWDSCFFSCATAPSDNNAAATATAMVLNFIRKSPFLDTDRWTTR
jgi:hypothetical protein